VALKMTTREVDGVTVIAMDGRIVLEGGVELVPRPGVVEQLRAVKDEGELELLRRAAAITDRAFERLLDVDFVGRRERDVAKRFVTAGRRRVQGRAFQAALDWRTVKRIKSRFKIPLAIKGIATAEDAGIALDHGVDWIYVSNHGGRQLDHGRGSMDVLPEVVAAVAGRAKIIVDGSICRGTDIVKAIATGADLVGIGRMQCFALAAGGEAGVVRLLELLEDEVQRCLGLLGVNKLSDLDRSYLHAAAPANALPRAPVIPSCAIGPNRNESSTAIGRAPMVKISRKIPPTPVVAP